MNTCPENCRTSFLCFIKGYKSLNFLREQRKAKAETSLIARTKPLTGYVIRVQFVNPDDK